MFTKFPLLEANPQLGNKDGIYRDTNEIFRDSKLSNYIQIAVADTFSQASDKSLFSLDIQRLSNTDELSSALSDLPFSFLQAFNFSGINHTLDLSEDFGGVAHFLADQVGSVDAIKVDPDLARLSTLRCANKHNVCHISEDLTNLNFPPASYDLIVIGQLEALGLQQDQLDVLLSKLKHALTDKGVLVVNAPNTNRLSRVFNQGQSALAFQDLYRSSHSSNNQNSNNHSSTQVSEISRRQFRNSLLNSGFAASEFHVTFSTDNHCRQLFSENYLTANVHALNHFYRLGSIDNAKISEFLLYQRLVEEKQNLVDLASRYIVLAGTNSDAIHAVYHNDFSHFPGHGRQAHWRSITQRRCAAPKVEKTALYSDQQVESDDQNANLVRQNLDLQDFHKGPLLVGQWLNALVANDHRELTSLIESYHRWLSEFAQQHDLATVAYDLLPFNLIVNERSGDYQVIDTEWQIKQSISADFILFRALFWFAFENKAVLNAFAKSNNVSSIANFIIRFLPNAHSLEDLKPFIELEESIQSEIDNDFRANAISLSVLQAFDKELAVEAPLSLQAAWSNSEQEVRLDQATLCDWQRSQQTQAVQVELAAYNAAYPILRIDPMSECGAIKITEFRVENAKGNVLWSGEASQATSSQGLMVADDLLLAINDDPYWLFDLSGVKNIDQAAKLTVSLCWVWGEHHSQSITALSTAIASMNIELVAQANRLNQYQADIEYQTQRIEDLVGHRKDLTEMLKEEEKRFKHERQTKQAQITHLEARLHAQHTRNDELHGYLLMRPSTRAKRVARRWLNKLTGKPMVEPLPPQPEPEPAPVANPLPTGELIGQNTEDYGLWVSENTLSDADIAAAKADIEAMKHKPVFSILVPIYNTDPEYLLPMIDSVRNQIYPHWQLCLVDDSSPKTYLKRILEHEALQDERICIQLNDVNQGISVTTNDALAMATGDYIALLDHDDEISIDALYENAKVINATPEAGLIYSDEDKMDMQGNRLEPYFKPDYSPDLLDTNNYICHFTVIKKSIIDEFGGFREGLDGSQDHDVILRAADAAEKIVHIPKILYHWRKIPGSTAVVYDSKSYAWEAGRKAVEDTRRKHEDNVRVEFGSLKGTYRVFREIKGKPLVSIIIPFKDKPELLDSCLNSILNRSSYQNFEIIGVSNNSEQELTHERMRAFAEQDSRISFVEHNVPFNFSEVCNYGVSQSKGKYIVLLNNDIEIITPNWIERMLEHAQRDEIGAVGCKLLYPDGRIQHAGVVAGMVGAAGHPHKFFPDNHIGYHGRLHMVYNTSAVTGAMMMMARSKFDEVGGLDADNLAVAYNDIDLCLKLLDKGYYNLFTPHAKATHHESISRGYEDTEEKMQRLLTEQQHFLTTWADFLAKGDPFYNPNLSLKNERFSLKFKD